MFAENLFRTRNTRLNVTVVVRSANLDFPQSEDEMYQDLLAHALVCHECLAAVLFEDASLAESGCRDYRRLLSEMRSELKVQKSLDAGAHLNEALLEEYSFNRLTEQQVLEMEKHVLICDACAARLRERQSWILCVNAAVREHTKSAKRDSVSGVVGVSAPDAAFSMCSRIKVS